nr:hypothetical protein CFP56_49433 [Quercus suber]
MLKALAIKGCKNLEAAELDTPNLVSRNSLMNKLSSYSFNTTSLQEVGLSFYLSCSFILCLDKLKEVVGKFNGYEGLNLVIHFEVLNEKILDRGFKSKFSQKRSFYVVKVEKLNGEEDSENSKRKECTAFNQGQPCDQGFELSSANLLAGAFSAFLHGHENLPFPYALPRRHSPSYMHPSVHKYFPDPCGAFPDKPPMYRSPFASGFSATVTPTFTAAVSEGELVKVVGVTLRVLPAWDRLRATVSITSSDFFFFVVVDTTSFGSSHSSASRIFCSGS